eukprot:1207507-Lingulodinium_polyedra.AAC.1
MAGLAATASHAAIYHCSVTVRLRSALTAVMMGPATVTRSGSNRQVGLSRPKTSSGAALAA